MSNSNSNAQTRALLLEEAGNRSVSDAQLKRDATEHEYLFDAKLFAQFTVKAARHKEARKKLQVFLVGALANFGELDGQKVREPVVLDDSGVDLLEIDGEAV